MWRYLSVVLLGLLWLGLSLRTTHRVLTGIVATPNGSEPRRHARDPPPPPRTTTTTTTSIDDLSDPGHTPRLERAPPGGKEFPVPAFHGCSQGDGGKGLCSFSNLCFAGRDNSLVFDVPGLRSKDNDGNEKENPAWYSEGHSHTNDFYHVRRPVLVPFEEVSKLTNVYWADRILAMNCVEQPDGGTNPAHMLMGMGKLFAYATGRWHTTSRFPDEHALPGEKAPVDLLLYHQCSTLSGWPWAAYVNNILWGDALKRGILEPPLSDGLMFLPWPYRNDLRPDDVVVCGRTVYQEPSTTATYFADNNYFVLERWQTVMDEAAASTNTNTNNANTPTTTSLSDRCASRTLRIAAFQRNEGSSLRLFRNMDEVEALAREFTDHPFEVITANSTTSPNEQMGLFRSFDVLITPHGSHLVNMIFNAKRSVFIEVASVFYDGAPHVNGMAFAKDWIPSFGHPPHGNPALAAKMPACATTRDARAEGPCPLATRRDFIHSDLVVNTTILRGDLERAARSLCPPPTTTTTTMPEG